MVLAVHESMGSRWDEAPHLQSIPKLLLSESYNKTETSTDSGTWLTPSLSIYQIESSVFRCWFEQLKHRNRDPVEKNELITAQKVIARTAHDFKSSLASIVGFCQLSRHSAPEEWPDFMDQIEMNASGLIELVNRYMTDFKNKRDNILVKREPFSIKNAFIDCLCDEISRVKEKGLSFVYDISNEIPDHLLLDRLLVCQITSNLIDNSIRYTDRGHIKVQLSYLSVEKLLLIDVSDTGSGITAENFEKIFESYENPIREPNGLERSSNSIGMGLNNARHLARIMGGDLVLLVSDKDKGATFRVSIPGEKNCSKSQH
jgi:signal transduction histidine kinase